MTEWAFAFNEYDRIYKSKVFTFTPDDLTAYQCPDIRHGLRHQEPSARRDRPMAAT